MIDPKRAHFMTAIAGAPFAKALKLTIDSAANGEAQVRMPWDELVLNPGGPRAPVHGGAVATLIDMAACAAVWSLEETQRSTTVALSVNYISAAIGTALVAEARVRHHGRTIASVNVEVRDSKGLLIADGLVTYKIA